MNLPGHKAVLAPGMSQVIEAGQEYTLKDDNGDELELIGKLDQPTIAFIRAFDLWLALKMRLGDGVDPTKAAWRALTEAFNNLGTHAVKEITK